MTRTKFLFPTRFFILCFFVFQLNGLAQEIVFSNDQCRVTFAAASLELTLQPHGRDAIQLSAPQKDPGPSVNLVQETNQASWLLADRNIRVSARLVGQDLSIGFSSIKSGPFTWPIAKPGPLAKAWILPMFEGVYVPSTDAKWIAHLTNSGGLSTTADLGLPFWGWDCGAFTIAVILTNQFNNELQFTAPDGRLQMTATHDLTRNHRVNEFGYVIHLGENSPIAPAKAYRAWLQSRGEFVTLAEKIQKIPATAKLLGAAHIYLWGDEMMAIDDVTNWKDFVLALKKQGEGWKIWGLLKPDAQKMVAEIITNQWPDRYEKGVVTEDLNRVLALPEYFHHEEKFMAAFPGLLAPKDSWGSGVSPKMVKQLADAGFDRLWLGAGSWDGFVSRPETVRLAKEKGFLIGPYDSYNGIHRPGDPNTWETSQFDQQLFDTGGIIMANGKPKNGFKQKGHMLSPRAARPYVEKRVDGLMKSFSANSWFMDCDGFGEFFDDYSPVHPATQQSDAAERVSRMNWIGTNYGAVVGSEGCSAVVAPAISFAHGVFTPVIGWGDKDLNDKKSQYYLGSYYPADGPAVFLKSVPIKENYRYLYYDPRFRLPLFETVFHDSVVATHHWSTPTLKFSEVITTTKLLELLYNVPPMYHLNPVEFQKRKTEMKTQYDFFSPLHRLAGLLPMTDFAWMSEDHMVQKTVFGDQLELTADFTKQTIQAKLLKTGETRTFTPKTP